LNGPPDNALKGWLRSHPEVAAIHHADLLAQPHTTGQSSWRGTCLVADHRKPTAVKPQNAQSANCLSPSISA
jgi:hypothetical protein